MDFSPALQPVFNALWYLIPIAILAGVFKSPWFKGAVGEFLVDASTRLPLDKDRHRRIRNVTLPTDDGTIQIDHVIVYVWSLFKVSTMNPQQCLPTDARQSTTEIT